ncbi:MAG: hypothetical protein NVS1B7_1800 [Candidatus Saccharimonadales bacterium]
MITKLKKLLIVGLGIGLISVPALSPTLVYAVENNTAGAACNGVNLDASKLDNTTAGGTSTCGDVGANGDNLTKLLKLVINIFSLIVGVVAVVMIIIGGLKYITSGGDSGNITGAKNTILYAIIGLIVVALAQFIVRFVLTKVGSTVGQ